MNSIQALISDDSFAISFQSMGQYRAALLKALNAEAHATTPAPDAEEPGELENLVLNLKFLRQELMALEEWPVRSWGLGYLDRTVTLLQQQEAELAALRPAAPPAPEVGDVGEGLSGRIASIAKAVQECAFTHEPEARLIGNVCAEDVADLCAAVLARWGRPAALPAPAVVPVAVAERLPGEGDCITNPRTGGGQWCWGWVQHDPASYSGRWRMMRREWLADEASHWLPFHAIPLPQGGEGEGAHG